MLASKLSPTELSFDGPTQEAMALTTADVEIVKATVTFTSFHCLEQPIIGIRFKAELVRAMPDPAVIPAWVELE